MNNRAFLLLSVFFVSAILSTPVNGADPLQENPRVFTNEDIERYHTSSGAGAADPGALRQEDRDRDRTYRENSLLEEHEMEYWCKKASTCNRRIEREKEAIKEIQDEILDAKTNVRSSRKKNSALEKKLESAKKRLRKAEADLNDLEDEAHRKGAKPGWLRCQI